MIILIYYITKQEHLELVQEVCAVKDLAIDCEINIDDIQCFVNQELKKLRHVKHFIIDVSVLKNSETDIMSAIISMKMMTQAQISIVALGYSLTHNLIQELIKCGIYNIVTSNDKHNAQQEVEKCLSDSGISKTDLIPENQNPFMSDSLSSTIKTEKPLDTKIPPIKDENINLSPKPLSTSKKSLIKDSVTIGVCGTQHHIGTTHHAIALTASLINLGYKACYLEANVHGDIQRLVEVYDDDESIDDDGALTWGGVQMYSNYYFNDVTKLDYQFYVYDYGVCSEVSSQEYLTKDIKVLVTGSKAWEYQLYLDIVNHISKAKNLHTIMNFAPIIDQDQLAYKGMEQTTYFPQYAPCPFEDRNNDNIYIKIIESFLDINQPNQVDNTTKRKWFFRKERK